MCFANQDDFVPPAVCRTTVFGRSLMISHYAGVTVVLSMIIVWKVSPAESNLFDALWIAEVRKEFGLLTLA